MTVIICREGLKKGIYAKGEGCRFPDVPCTRCLVGRKQKTAEKAVEPTNKDGETLKEKFKPDENFSYKKKIRALGRKKIKAWQKDPQAKEKVKKMRAQKEFKEFHVTD